MTSPVVVNYPSFDMWTFTGTFGAAASPVEVWSFSIKCEPGAGGIEETVPEAQIGLNAYQNLRNRLPATVVLTQVRYSKHLAGTGLVIKDAGGQYVQGDVLTSQPGLGTGGSVLPLQTALCVSLDTMRAGPTGKGRFFLPFPAMAIAADFRLSVVDRDGLAAVLSQFLGGLNLATKPLVVASSKGVRSQVVSYRVGRVPDTMRSRRGDLLEDYVTSPLPA